MQPFPVTCETCRARLKIRDASVIGEIHACPRCGGMVRIIPPAGWASDAPSDSTPVVTLAPPRIPQPATLVPENLAPENLGETWVPGASAHDFNIDEALAAPSPAIASNSNGPVAPAANVETNTNDETVPPTTDALTTSILQRALAQPILLWGGLAAAVLFIGGFSTALWLTGDDPPATNPPATLATTPVEIERTTSQNAAPSPPSDDHVKSNGIEPVATDAISDVAAPTAPAPIGDEHQVARPIVEEQPLDAAKSLTNQQVLPELPPDDPAPLNDASVATNAPMPTEVQPPAPLTPATEASAMPVLKFDPLNFDPLALGLSTNTSDAAGAPHASVADSANLDPLPPPSAESEALPSDKDLFQPESDTSVTAQRGPAADVDLPDLNVTEQLAISIESIDMPVVSLASFLNSVAKLADLPITLDPAALAMAGVSPRAEIAVRAHNTTLEKLLRDTLKKQRLDFVSRDGQIIVVRPSVDARRSVNYELADLVGESASAGGTANEAMSSLTQLLERYVAPHTWQSAGDKGSIKIDGTKLVVDQTHGVHYQILIFFERLRRARDLAPRSQYPVKLLSIESPYSQLSEALDEPTTFTFLPWTPLAEVIEHCQDATKLTILVDWVALADIGLAPSSPVSCSAVERQWDDALTAILAEFGLAWSAVGDQTIQITSQDVADRAQQIEFYAIAPEFRQQFSSEDALVDTLEAELSEKLPPRIGSSPAQLTIDAPSARLIVLANAAAHRYVAQRLSGVVTDHVADTNAAAESQRVSAQPLP